MLKYIMKKVKDLKVGDETSRGVVKRVDFIGKDTVIVYLLLPPSGRRDDGTFTTDSNTEIPVIVEESE